MPIRSLWLLVTLDEFLLFLLKFYDYLLIANEEPRAFFDVFDFTLFKS